jgi:hypothetical protein
MIQMGLLQAGGGACARWGCSVTSFSEHDAEHVRADSCMSSGKLLCIENYCQVRWYGSTVVRWYGGMAVRWRCGSPGLLTQTIDPACLECLHRSRSQVLMPADRSSSPAASSQVTRVPPGPGAVLNREKATGGGWRPSVVRTSRGPGLRIGLRLQEGATCSQGATCARGPRLHTGGTGHSRQGTLAAAWLLWT